MDDEVLAYKDLAAIPRDKAILDIERPDLMIYEPHFTYSLLDHVDRPGSREVRPAVGGAGLGKGSLLPARSEAGMFFGLRSSPTMWPPILLGEWRTARLSRCSQTSFVQ